MNKSSMVLHALASHCLIDKIVSHQRAVTAMVILTVTNRENIQLMCICDIWWECADLNKSNDAILSSFE